MLVKEMMEICSVTEEATSKLYESYEIVGTLKPEIAAELGLSENVKVVAGAGDNRGGSRNRNRRRQECNISLGTSARFYFQQNIQCG